jgi:hypothetical protein
VPHYKELKIETIFDEVVEKHKEMVEYFPLYEPDSDATELQKPYLPPKPFFWIVYTTLYKAEAAAKIESERKKRYLKDEKEKCKTIMIDTKILDVLQGSSFFSKKKGRALFKMKPRQVIKPGVKRHFRDVESGSERAMTERNSDRGPGRRYKRKKIIERRSADKVISVKSHTQVKGGNYADAVSMDDADQDESNELLDEEDA